MFRTKTFLSVVRYVSPDLWIDFDSDEFNSTQAENLLWRPLVQQEVEYAIPPQTRPISRSFKEQFKNLRLLKVYKAKYSDKFVKDLDIVSHSYIESVWDEIPSLMVDLGSETISWAKKLLESRNESHYHILGHTLGMGPILLRLGNPQSLRALMSHEETNAWLNQWLLSLYDDHIVRLEDWENRRKFIPPLDNIKWYLSSIFHLSDRLIVISNLARAFPWSLEDQETLDFLLSSVVSYEAPTYLFIQDFLINSLNFDLWNYLLEKVTEEERNQILVTLIDLASDDSKRFEIILQEYQERLREKSLGRKISYTSFALDCLRRVDIEDLLDRENQFTVQKDFIIAYELFTTILKEYNNSQRTYLNANFGKLLEIWISNEIQITSTYMSVLLPYFSRSELEAIEKVSPQVLVEGHEVFVPLLKAFLKALKI